MHLSILDILIFSTYFIGVVMFAVIVAARSKTKSAMDFFLASQKLPWYAIGASFVASNISTEHFIGMVGWGFLYGMAVANWEWGNAITLSALIWIFLPFYMRGNVATMPEFLEKRFNSTCRRIYAIVMIVGLVIAMLGGVLFAGAKAVNIFFPEVPVWVGIFALATAAGIYTIYGGLLSAVWADLLQYALLMIGGTIVTIYGLYYAGGIDNLFRELPEKFIVFYPATHEMAPWTGIVVGIFSVGLWYSCANQFMVQRCLGARSEWDGRMGVVMALFSKAFLPLIIVVPGIIAFYLFQGEISDGDQAWPYMVSKFLPSGFVGLVLAGLASAILSTLSAITNSSATIFTLDIYKPIFRKDASDHELHFVGRISSLIIMLVGVAIGLFFVFLPGITVFQLIQTVFFYISPPISAIFLVGILWRRATSMAATVTLIVGFVVFLPLVKFVLFPLVPALAPYDNFMHHTFTIFVLSVILLVVLSLFTTPKPKEQLEGVIWTRKALGVSDKEKGKYGGLRSLHLWWFLSVALIIGLYIYTNIHGSNAIWLEAEKLVYKTSEGLSVRLQKRDELAKKEKFNLWTGSGQVLFVPAKDNDFIAFNVPVKKSGPYQIALLVTRGVDYGQFSVTVNDQLAVISYFVNEAIEGKKFTVVKHQTDIFDGKLIEDTVSNTVKSAIGNHVMQRINLGDFELTEGLTQIKLITKNFNGQDNFIGIDQVILIHKSE